MLARKHQELKQRAIEQLKVWQGERDLETAHVEADGILCGLLIDLGMKEVVEEYEKVSKWYA